MRGSRAIRIESATDRAAAAILGASIGYALLILLNGSAAQPQLSAYAAGAAIAAYLICARALQSISGDDARFEMPVFELAAIEPQPFDETRSADANPVPTGEEEQDEEENAVAGELLLDDILAEIEPNSRVVRLFDPSAMPTPGQLNARIEQHLGESRAAPPDASQALYDALAELRRSLR